MQRLHNASFKYEPKSSPKFRARKKMRDKERSETVRREELRNVVKASEDIALLFYIPDINNKNTSPFLPHLIDLLIQMLQAKNLP